MTFDVKWRNSALATSGSFVRTLVPTTMEIVHVVLRYSHPAYSAASCSRPPTAFDSGQFVCRSHVAHQAIGLIVYAFSHCSIGMLAE